MPGLGHEERIPFAGEVTSTDLVRCHQRSTAGWDGPISDSTPATAAQGRSQEISEGGRD
jgi:hypothetical protein